MQGTNKCPKQQLEKHLFCTQYIASNTAARGGFGREVLLRY